MSVDVGVLAIPTVSDQACTTNRGKRIHGSLALLEVANVPNGEDEHGGRHEDGIEDVKEDLVRDKVSAVSLEVLDDAKDAPDEDEETGCEEGVEVALPGNDSFGGGSGGLFAHTVVDGQRGEDEDAENDDLCE